MFSGFSNCAFLLLACLLMASTTLAKSSHPQFKSGFISKSRFDGGNLGLKPLPMLARAKRDDLSQQFESLKREVDQLFQEQRKNEDTIRKLSGSIAIISLSIKGDKATEEEKKKVMAEVEHVGTPKPLKTADRSFGAAISRAEARLDKLFSEARHQVNQLSAIAERSIAGGGRNAQAEQHLTGLFKQVQQEIAQLRAMAN